MCWRKENVWKIHLNHTMPSSSASLTLLLLLLLTMDFGTSFFKCVCHFTLFVHFVFYIFSFLFGICVLSSASISIYTVSASPLLCCQFLWQNIFRSLHFRNSIFGFLWKYSYFFLSFIIMSLRCRFFYLFLAILFAFFYRRHTNIDVP